MLAQLAVRGINRARCIQHRVRRIALAKHQQALAQRELRFQDTGTLWVQQLLMLRQCTPQKRQCFQPIFNDREPDSGSD